MSAMGRPKKLKDEREKFSMYIDKETRKQMNEYIFKVQQETPGYSRSDFVNEAIRHFLAEKGKETE